MLLGLSISAVGALMLSLPLYFTSYTKIDTGLTGELFRNGLIIAGAILPFALIFLWLGIIILDVGMFIEYKKWKIRKSPNKYVGTIEALIPVEWNKRGKPKLCNVLVKIQNTNGENLFIRSYNRVNPKHYKIGERIGISVCNDYGYVYNVVE